MTHCRGGALPLPSEIRRISGNSLIAWGDVILPRKITGRGSAPPLQNISCKQTYPNILYKEQFVCIFRKNA